MVGQNSVVAPAVLMGGAEALARVRPPHPPVQPPGLEWLRHVNGDRVTALEQFVTGWYPATAGTHGSSMRRRALRSPV